MLPRVDVGRRLGFMFTIGVTLVAIPLHGLHRRLDVPAPAAAPRHRSGDELDAVHCDLIDVLGIIVYFNMAKLFLAEVIAAHMHAG